MDWGVVDTEAATWTVPASRIKARREHRVPLSRRALAILEEARCLGTGSGLVFPSQKGKPLSNMAFTMVLRRLDVGNAVPHGFRSTSKDWTLEQTTFSWAVVETALAHTLGSATESAYARSDLFDRRRELMETWAGHCEPGGSPPTAAASPGDSTVRASAAAAKQPLGERVRLAFRGASGIADQAKQATGTQPAQRLPLHPNPH